MFFFYKRLTRTRELFFSKKSIVTNEKEKDNDLTFIFIKIFFFINFFINNIFIIYTIVVYLFRIRFVYVIFYYYRIFFLL